MIISGMILKEQNNINENVIVGCHAYCTKHEFEIRFYCIYNYILYALHCYIFILCHAKSSDLDRLFFSGSLPSCNRNPIISCLTVKVISKVAF